MAARHQAGLQQYPVAEARSIRGGGCPDEAVVEGSLDRRHPTCLGQGHSTVYAGESLPA